MTATYDPLRILILLIQIERDHLNYWQALLTVLPLNSPWSGARSIQGRKALVRQLPSIMWVLHRHCCVGSKQQGMGPDQHAISLENYHGQHGKGCNVIFQGSGQLPTGTA